MIASGKDRVGTGWPWKCCQLPTITLSTSQYPCEKDIVHCQMSINGNIRNTDTKVKQVLITSVSSSNLSYLQFNLTLWLWPRTLILVILKKKIKLINRCNLILQDLKHFKTVIISSYKTFQSHKVCTKCAQSVTNGSQSSLNTHLEMVWVVSGGGNQF